MDTWKGKAAVRSRALLTGASVVSRIYTDLAVIDVDRQNASLALVEVALGVTLEFVSSQTGTELKYGS